MEHPLRSKKQSYSQQIGAQAEQRAEIFLRKQGLKFISRNYRCRVGEIDLIMQDKENLVFIEVRYRSTNSHGNSIETINHVKQHKLIKAAKFYLVQQSLYEKIPCRFDVVALAKNSDEIDWIRDAFQVQY